MSLKVVGLPQRGWASAAYLSAIKTRVAVNQYTIRMRLQVVKGRKVEGREVVTHIDTDRHGVTVQITVRWRARVAPSAVRKLVPVVRYCVSCCLSGHVVCWTQASFCLIPPAKQGSSDHAQHLLALHSSRHPAPAASCSSSAVRNSVNDQTGEENILRDKYDCTRFAQKIGLILSPLLCGVRLGLHGSGAIDSLCPSNCSSFNSILAPFSRFSV